MEAIQHQLPTAGNPIVGREQAELDGRAMSALLRKIDIRLMPLLTLLYFFTYLGRINIGQISDFKLQARFKLGKPDYKWTVSIFFISYMLWTLPSCLLMRRFSPRKWIAILMFACGTIVILMTFSTSFSSLLVARFVLGMGQAGFVPGVIFYLSLWYIRKDQAFRMGIFFTGPALASAFDRILAFCINTIYDERSISKWYCLCLVEGIPTVGLVILTYKFLADPATVQWLDQCYKDILTERLLTDAEIIGDTDNEPLFHQIRSVCFDWKVWLYIFMYMGAAAPIYGINAFLPTIIEDMCYPNATICTNVTVELLTIPPYISSCLTILISSWNAGRLNERSNHIMVLLLIQIIGFFYLILAEQYLYVGVMIVGTSMLSSNALILSWMTNNVGGRTKRAVAAALIVAPASIGSIVGDEIYRGSNKDQIRQGHWIVISILSYTFILVLLLKLLFKFQNRRRRDLVVIQVRAETVAGVEQILCDQYPHFLYVT